MTNAKPDTMQAAAIDRFGGAELVTVRAVPVPEVGPSDVLIRVEVAGVASWDALEREGRYDGLSECRRHSPMCSAGTARAQSSPLAARLAASRKATGCTLHPCHFPRVEPTPRTR